MSNYVVLGSSGKIGGAVVKSLVKKNPSAHVYAGVRDLSSEKAKSLTSLGSNVSLFHLDFAKPDTFKNIPMNADGILINTPSDFNRTKLTIAGIEAAKNAGGQHLVIVSSPYLTEKILFGRQNVPIEKHLISSGVPYTIIRLPMFMENYLAHVESVKSEGKIYGSHKPDVRFSAIAISDVGEAVALILEDARKHKNTIYNIVTKPFSSNDLARAFSDALGKRVEYEQIPYEKSKENIAKHFSEWEADAIIEVVKLVNEGDRSIVLKEGDFESIVGRAPLTIEQWTSKVAASFK